MSTREKHLTFPGKKFNMIQDKPAVAFIAICFIIMVLVLVFGAFVVPKI